MEGWALSVHSTSTVSGNIVLLAVNMACYIMLHCPFKFTRLALLMKVTARGPHSSPTGILSCPSDRLERASLSQTWGPAHFAVCTHQSLPDLLKTPLAQHI